MIIQLIDSFEEYMYTCVRSGIKWIHVKIYLIFSIKIESKEDKNYIYIPFFTQLPSISKHFKLQKMIGISKTLNIPITSINHKDENRNNYWFKTSLKYALTDEVRI